MRGLTAGLTILSGGLACAPALAQTGVTAPQAENFIRGGISYVDVAEDIDVTLGGAPLPGAGVDLASATSVQVEYGRYLTDAVSLSLSFSGPFETDNIAAGSLAGAGNIATDTFGIVTAGGQWHFNRAGTFSPYIGGGLAYFHVFDVEDGIAVGAEIDNAFGAMLQAGVEARVADNKALFIDLRRMFLEIDSRGTLMGLPIAATSTLDPLIISAGISFEF